MNTLAYKMTAIIKSRKILTISSSKYSKTIFKKEIEKIPMKPKKGKKVPIIYFNRRLISLDCQTIKMGERTGSS